MNHAAPHPPLPVLIVGAGIGGLTLGYRLHRAGVPVLLVEAAERSGGALATEEIDGFRVEWGAHTMLADQGCLQLVSELGLDEATARPGVRAANRFVAARAADGRIVPVAAPRSLAAAVRSPLLSLSGKVRLLREPFISRSREDDLSVRAFLSRRIGSEAVDSLAAAALSGIYAGDIDKLSARSTLPALWRWERESGSLIRGALARRSSSSGGRRAVLSFDGGMSTLVAALSAALGPSIRYGTRAARITEHSDAIELTLADGTVLSGSSLVLTGSAGASADLIEAIDPALARELRAIPYAPLGVLHLSWPRSAVQHPLDGFGVLIPPRFGTAVRGMLFISTLFPERAPNGRVLLSCFVGGAVAPQWSDVTNPEVRHRVVEELSELLGTEGAPLLVSGRYLRQAIPNYAPGHYRVVERAAEAERTHPRLVLLGNWRDGVGVPDRINRAESAARAILSARSSPEAAR